MNQIRGLQAEHGVVMGRDISRLRHGLRQIAEGTADGLGDVIRDLVHDVHQELAELDQRIATYNRRIRHLFQTNEECQRIGKIEGIGPITATALVAAVGDRAELTALTHSRHWRGFIELVQWVHEIGAQVSFRLCLDQNPQPINGECPLSESCTERTDQSAFGRFRAASRLPS